MTPPGAMRPVGSFRVPADHPCLPGHFPGAPLVPGVVLLDEILALLAAAHPGPAVAGLPQARFVAPVLPGQTVEVSAAAPAAGGGGGGRIAFVGAVAGREVLRGAAELASAP